MGNIDFVEEWLDFQSNDVFQGTIDEVQNWVDTSDVSGKTIDLDYDYDGIQIIDDLDVDVGGNNTDLGLNSLKVDLGVLLDGYVLDGDLEAKLQKFNLHLNPIHSENFTNDQNIDDKENNYMKKNQSQISLYSARKTRDLNSTKSIHIGNLSEGKIDKEDSSSTGSGKLILDQLPDFKSKPYINWEDSLCIRPEVLNKTDGEITYYKDIDLIPDQTWLPRKFQHHKVKANLLQGCDPIHHYHKNPNCPKSSEGESSTFKNLDHIKNLSTYRYSRKSKFSKKIEVMCRLCRGQNWVPKAKFKHHMAFSHGVLIPFHKEHQSKTGGSALSLVKSPISLYTSKNRKFTNFFVKCPKCEKWIKLGLGENSRKTGKSFNGLYHNYFLHFLKTHEGAGHDS
ncbi:hypothetical protein BN7_3837 [Wickerhamomyces ciferrii]|uniref:Transcription regulator Rua1 C-terminal domain-containing protein n=1 Tax=Wickerhamomyces ciferrii (strain ATCC 14091 / BCRC 22168 / CBS 111 / JCM 3599 / NBRC 0793 / NRRL Y-1031 F-60-10) TaxID=1206466 RepID=K0KMW2_WICCF|nr:uncharacterized protein BN7_3837 [Wickerhamomyces ciferrii]CCH44276.1 hypothetical protein BN7_3837 [Wickerhamomyces ciferrii]